MRDLDYTVRYCTTFALFGKLVVGADGLTGRLEVDTTGWNGDSDLQVCTYVPTNGLYNGGSSV
jgi:hypothetical protein